MKSIFDWIAVLVAIVLVFGPTPLLAAPKGGRVAAGNAQIKQSKAVTRINQRSNRAIINWHSFDIGKKESVTHTMPSANSAALHRVTGGGGASQISGKLESNGNIYLVNPAGVVIHNGARVKTNSFVATSRDIANDNFMKEKLVFDRPGKPDAKIINKGEISVAEKGLAALVGPTVRNDGVIAGNLARVALAGGHSTFSLDMHGDKLVTFAVDDKAAGELYSADGKKLKASATNTGSIKTNGGVVVLTASQFDGIVGGVVNSGGIEAGDVSFRSGSSIQHTGSIVAARKDNGGSVRMDARTSLRFSGSVDARGGQKGGSVVLTGTRVAVEKGASIDASGKRGGGTVLVGGSRQGKGPERNAKKTTVAAQTVIRADAQDKGDGGTVVVWSDEHTRFDGTISAQGGRRGGNGGFVETSGAKLEIGKSASVYTNALLGRVGTWLLDPHNFVIAASGGDMTGSTLSSNLQNSAVTISSDKGKSGQAGDIIFRDAVDWNTKNFLTLDAYRNVNFGTIDLTGAKINLSNRTKAVLINNATYSIVRTLDELQGIENSINYVLAKDIDAKATSSWNSGAGFVPIARYIGYSGKFNGLGHTISNLTINRPNDYDVGLFSRLSQSGEIINLVLQKAKVIGYMCVGSVVGTNFGSVSYVASKEGSVEAKGSSGPFPVYDQSAYYESYAGGIAGHNDDYGKIANSSYTGTVKGKALIGGIAGCTDVLIENSESDATVTGELGVGGIAGRLLSGNIKKSIAHGTVSGKTLTGKTVGHVVEGYIIDDETGDVVEDDGSGGSRGHTGKNCPEPSDPKANEEVKMDKEVFRENSTTAFRVVLPSRDGTISYDASSYFLDDVAYDVNEVVAYEESLEEQAKEDYEKNPDFAKAVAFYETVSGASSGVLEMPKFKLTQQQLQRAATIGLARRYSKRAKDSRTKAEYALRGDRSPMNPQKNDAVLRGMGDAIVNSVALRTLYTEVSTQPKEVLGAGPAQRGRSAERGQRGREQRAIPATVALGGISEFSGMTESLLASVPEGSGRLLMKTMSRDGDGIVRVHPSASMAIDPHVTRSVNSMLDSVFSSMSRAQVPTRSGNFAQRSTDAVMNALQNDEKLHRYIDLYNHYVKEKMALAGAIMG